MSTGIQTPQRSISKVNLSRNGGNEGTTLRALSRILSFSMSKRTIFGSDPNLPHGTSVSNRSTSLKSAPEIAETKLYQLDTIELGRVRGV